MTDEKTATKTTPESTKRFRLTIAALKNVEDADDKSVRALIGEFQTFFQLYVDQRMREVEAREPLPFQSEHVGKLMAAEKAEASRVIEQHIQAQKAQMDPIRAGTTPTTNWGDQRIK